MVVNIPKAGVTLKAVTEGYFSFYQIASIKHLNLINNLFSKIRNKGTYLLSVEDSIEFQDIKKVVDLITNTTEGYSEGVLFIHNLELYHQNSFVPEYELSLYSCDGEIRWGASTEPFRDQTYFETWVKDTLEVLINNL